MNLLFVITVILLLISTIIKTILWVKLDNRNGHKTEIGMGRGYIYFFPYRKDVSQEDIEMKNTCNLIHKIFILSLILFFITFFIKKSMQA